MPTQHAANTPTAQVDFLFQASMAREVDQQQQQQQQQHCDHAQPVQWQQAQQSHANTTYNQQQIRQRMQIMQQHPQQQHPQQQHPQQQHPRLQYPRLQAHRPEAHQFQVPFQAQQRPAWAYGQAAHASTPIGVTAAPTVLPTTVYPTTHSSVDGAFHQPSAPRSYATHSLQFTDAELPVIQPTLQPYNPYSTVQPADQDMVVLDLVQPHDHFQSPYSQAITGEFAGPLQYAAPELTPQQLDDGYDRKTTQGVLGSFPPHQGSPGIAYSQTPAQSTLPPSLPPMSPNGGVFRNQGQVSLDGQAPNSGFENQLLATGKGRKTRDKAKQHRDGPRESWYNPYINREFHQRVLAGQGRTSISRQLALVLSIDMRKKGLVPNFLSPDSVNCRNRRMNKPDSKPPPPLTAEQKQLVAAAEAEADQASEVEKEEVRLSWPKEKNTKKPEVS